MVDISVGCINENTYGVSCVHCGNCGRKFTNNGINDRDVVNKKVEQYKAGINSKLWKDIEISIKDKVGEK